MLVENVQILSIYLHGVVMRSNNDIRDRGVDRIDDEGSYIKCNTSGHQLVANVKRSLPSLYHTTPRSLLQAIVTGQKLIVNQLSCRWPTGWVPLEHST
jgi:hypothetical protein